MRDWINMYTLIALLVGVFASAMIKSWLSRAKSTVAG